MPNGWTTHEREVAELRERLAAAERVVEAARRVYNLPPGHWYPYGDERGERPMVGQVVVKGLLRDALEAHEKAYSAKQEGE